MVEHTMRTILLFNIVPIAVVLGGCTNGAGSQNYDEDIEHLEDCYSFATSQWGAWSRTSQTQVLPGDFNADGKLDVVKFDNGSPGGVWVGLSTGTSFEISRWANVVMTPSTHVLPG